MIIVEDKVAYKDVEVDTKVVEVDMKVVASMYDAMVVYYAKMFEAIVDKVEVVANLHTMDLGLRIVDMV